MSNFLFRLHYLLSLALLSLPSLREVSYGLEDCFLEVTDCVRKHRNNEKNGRLSP